MLVLTRRTDEAIKIGDDIEITIIGIEGDQVKLGITAPSQVEIHRKEIYLSIKQENSDAANTSLNIMDQLKALKK
ncbi:carbon storage regulator, CsrA [Fictibacillus solisalsi]|uniref:Translational regulator CsrA n=1 Tax=Fictibacillus solisalsi TaxID=459525 RepID=A0A1G9XZC9_9BACL|nr:carbon storage regulator CsrA [Fictibacillus solisalsi]SDN02144.1 carbon storage regulator, CsrA [Fictibacillus solisalsi]